MWSNDQLYQMGMSVVLWDHFYVIGYPEMMQHSKLKQTINIEKIYFNILGIIEIFHVY